VNSFGENNWGASWTTISEETDVTLENMNGGSALNYLMLGFFNVIWIPTAMKFGRKIVYILSLIFVGASGIWGGFYTGTVQYYVMLCVSGMGTAAYQALIQLTVCFTSRLGFCAFADCWKIFDTFFAHERGRMISIYIFFQQLGSILGLILGGYISDGVGWRWSMPIVAMACVSVRHSPIIATTVSNIYQAALILLFIFTFDDTMFPRYRFTERTPLGSSKVEQSSETSPEMQPEKHQKEEPHLLVTQSHGAGEVDMPPRTYRQKIALVHYFKDDRTTWYQYFRRPFYLFAFPNIVLAGIQFAFGCTAGIVSFNTISEIMTEAPYNWSNGSTGLLFLAALIGSFIG
jgi:MFS family permease